MTKEKGLILPFSISLVSAFERISLNNGQSLATRGNNFLTVSFSFLVLGPAGEFDIIIDTTGTEVDLKYDVTLTLANCPRNITFSKKGPGEAGATEISAGGAGNTLSRTLTFSK